MNILEACTGSYKQALEAYKKGATRIELCDNLSEGGTTPSYGTIKQAISDIPIPINVIVRPRGGNFIYSGVEANIILEDINAICALGANGIVFGALTPDSKIDIKLLNLVMEACGNTSLTFHMAFDEIINKKEAIDILSKMGVSRILTKGGSGSAPNNLDTLKELVAYSKNKLIIIPGGGVTNLNREEIASITKASELHGTCIVGPLNN